MIHCHSNAAARLPALVHAELEAALGHLRPRRIVIKPNWVMNETDPRYPIAAMVTDARLIDAAVRACVGLFPAVEQITIGDCLEQRADWPLMCRQSGLTPIIEQWAATDGRVQFRDLRKDVYRTEIGDLVPDRTAVHGDPAGYREVQLNAESHLEPIADQADKFSIHDHDNDLTRGSHRAGDHRYLVCQTVLDADLIINLPKWKAHSKSGITGALKNLVGINGDKSYLPHFRRGSPRWGGDEYSDEGRWLYWVQNNVYAVVRGTPVHGWLRPGWRVIKSVNNALRRRSATPQSMPSDFYVVGGSWYGNQTLWRMIFDLNLVVRRADREGRLQPTPQRDYFCLVDGLVAGEGDGPLKAQPRPLDMLIAGADPFEVDLALAWMMGFDPSRIPVLSERRQFLGGDWGAFEERAPMMRVDGDERPLRDWPIHFAFVPPPGWLGHVERERPPLPRSA
jgi:uncharacterized protein (DUF362 family)